MGSNIEDTACLDHSNDVVLVKPREADQRLIVSSRETDRIRADDLLALANQIAGSRELVRNRACDRLSDIAEQMQSLYQKAVTILEEAKRDEDLHQIACNMQKIPGRMYHLYKKDDGVKFFSMLSPVEWNSPIKEKQYCGSYRLEVDRSWTPIDQITKRDTQFARFGEMEDSVLQRLGYA